MQARLFKNQDSIKNAFIDSQNRIRSMSLAHEKLYSTNNVASIEISDYVSSLVNHISQIYYSYDKSIKINLDLDNVYLGMDATIPLGLIINEIVTNSYKHAFVNRAEGHISISFKELDDFYELIVEDNGTGIPENFDYDQSKSLGFKIINLLVEQLHANINIDTSKKEHVII